MIKKVLVEKSITWGQLSENSLVDNDVLKKLALEDCNKFVPHFKNRHNDINNTYHKYYTWILEYIRDHYIKHSFQNLTLECLNSFINREKKFESTFKRNHINPYDLNNSPEMTVLYFIQGGGGELTLEWDNGRYKDCFNKFAVKDKQFFIFNSDFDYYLTKNTEKDDRVYITYNCLLK